MAVTIRLLEEFDEVENLNCGDEPLNSYLKRHAWTNQQKISIGVTYAVVDESAPHIELGYFTLATQLHQDHDQRTGRPQRRAEESPAPYLPCWADAPLLSVSTRAQPQSSLQPN